MKISSIFHSTVFLLLSYCTHARYHPNWESLDTRPIPDWFDKAKVGIFLHWGVYAVPSFGGSSEWFWAYWADQEESYVNFMNENYKPSFTYQDFAKDFSAEFYNPTEWADLFAKAGARYVVLTSKHHEGYTMWPSKHSHSWNVKDVGPNRNLLGDLAEAVRGQDLRFGAYYSLYEWYNPLYSDDKVNNFTTNKFVSEKMLPEMVELIDNYQPEVLWIDGDWEANDTYFKSTDFLAWLYNDSPVKDTIVTNDRWGIGIPCTHGDFFSCKDRFNPGILQLHKWENAMTLDRNSWGYRRNMKYADVLTAKELITTLAQTVSCGGNILINVGPSKEGTIVPIFQERLQELGKWLAINGEAIYESKPWTVQNDTLTSGVWYTSKAPNIYAIILDWPQDNILSLGSVAPLFENTTAAVTLLGIKDELTVSKCGNKVDVTFPNKGLVLTEWAWVLKITPS